MGFAILDSEGKLRLADGAKILKGAQTRAISEAQLLLDEARARAVTIADKAAREADALRQSAHAEAVHRAKQDVAIELTQAAVAAAKTLAAVEERIAALVVRAVQGLIGQGNRGALYREALRRVAEQMRDECVLTLRVAPQQEAAATDAIADFSAQHPAARHVQLEVDATLSADQCLIETANAMVDVGLDAQLAALGAALRADLKA